MPDDDKRKDPEAKRGELIRPGPPLPIAAPTGLQRTLYRLFGRLSIFPSFNRSYVKSLKTAKEVFEAKNELGKAIGEHQEIRDRLKHFGDILDLRGEERKRALFEEKERRRAAENTFKHEEKMQAKKNKQKEEEVEIERMAQKLRKLGLKKQLDELIQPPPPPPEPPQKKTTRGRSPKQKDRDDAQKRYEKEIARIEAMRGRTAEAQEDLKKSAAKDQLMRCPHGQNATKEGNKEHGGQNNLPLFYEVVEECNHWEDNKEPRYEDSDTFHKRLLVCCYSKQ